MTHRDAAERPTAAEVAAQLGAPHALPGPAMPDNRGVETGELEETHEHRVQPATANRRAHVARNAAAAVVVVVAVVGGTLALGAGGRGSPDDPAPVIPSGVPTRMQEPLKELHAAIEDHR
jgi:hypothetical protein